MAYIEKYVYDWLIARRRALATKCTFNKKGEFESTDHTAFTELGRAEQALEKYATEWLLDEVEVVEAGAEIESASKVSKTLYPPREPAK